MNFVRLTNSVLPSALAVGLPGGGQADPKLSIYNAWNSGAADSVHGAIYFTRHGGHGDYAGNQVFKFDINTGLWTQLSPPSASYVPQTSNNPPDSSYTPIYSDGTPASVHHYDSECYMPTVHKIWSAGGIYWSPPGLSTNSTFLFNLNNNSWEKITDRPGGSFAASVWDPVDEVVLFRTSGGFYSYNPKTNAYTTLFTGSLPANSPSETSTLALDPTGRKVYFNVRNFSNVAPFRIRMIDLNNLALKDQVISVTGDTVIGSLAGLGLLWDTDRLVAYGVNLANTEAELFTLDPNNPVWVRRAATGAPNKPSTNGIWKRFFKYNGTLYAVLSGGVESVVPDWGASPAPTITISVAGDLNVDYQFIAAPPTPPTPPGGSSPIPANTWTMVPSLPTGTPTTVRAGKHMRLAYDSNRGRWLIAGGDRFGSDGGQPAVEAFDPTTGLSSLLSPQCTSTSEYMPNFPDTVAWCYDSTRDRCLMFRGFYFGTARSKYVTSGTVTPSATSGLDVPFVSSVNVFEPWMALSGGSGAFTNGLGFRLRQPSAPGGSTIIAEGWMKTYVSPTQMNVNISTALPFATTSAIGANSWILSGILSGDAALPFKCNRNIFAGDNKVLYDDCIYNCTTNKWEPKTWPTSPLGLGTDPGGPSWAVYHEATDAAYLIKNSNGYKLMILHCDTNTWEIVSFASGMVTGTERSLVASANSYRAQMALVGDDIYFMSNRTGFFCIIRYQIPTKTWNAWPTPVGYGQIPDDSEPLLVYDPISNVLLHPFATDVTGPTLNLYIFDIATKTWSVRAIPPGTSLNNEPVNNGQPYFNLETQSMFMYGRKASGVPGYPCYNYRYTSTG